MLSTEVGGLQKLVLYQILASSEKQGYINYTSYFVRPQVPLQCLFTINMKTKRVMSAEWLCICGSYHLVLFKFKFYLLFSRSP